MRCVVCSKGPMDGVTIYQVNRKGIEGMWVCRQHKTPATLSHDLADIISVLEER